MAPFDWFKKEKPLQSLTSLGGGAVGGAMAGGVSEGGPYSITGGTTQTPGNGYKYFVIMHDTPAPESNLSITQDGSPGYINISFLAVGGGGAGGVGGSNDWGSGGGGGGAAVQKMDYEDIILAGPDTWPVSIGQGGMARDRASPAPQGGVPANPNPDGPYKGGSTVITIPSPKSPLTITAVGGGGGLASPTNSPATTESGTFGSGGGAPHGSPSNGQYELNGIVAPAGVPQTIDADGNTPLSGIGYAGGQGQRTGQYNGPANSGSGGGGGGAGQVGQNAIPGGPIPTSNPRAKGGEGGHGIRAFNGDSGVNPYGEGGGPQPGRYFAGGGGGGQADGGPHYQGGPGGTGGGGSGGGSDNYPWGPTASPGQVHTGGGGGGSGGIYTVTPTFRSAPGGPGIVIFRVPTSILT